MKTLKVGVIGLGVGEQHVTGYLNHPACEVVALCDLSNEKLVLLKKKYTHIQQYTSQATEIIANPCVDIVSIASYDQTHFEYTLAALQAQKHVFVEKPLCRSIQELRAVKQAWAAGGNLQLCSNLVLRAAPIYRWLRAQIEAGELGQIFAFDGDYLYGRIHKITDGWRKDVEQYSVIQGGGVHLVDLMLWLTGQRPESVTATGNRICTAGTAFRYFDYAAATYRFASGMVGRITANFGCMHRHQHVVRIFGTKATFIYDDRGPRLHATRDPEVPAATPELRALPASKADLIPRFVDAILVGEDARRNTQHEFDVISASAAADLALSTVRPLEIEYV